MQQIGVKRALGACLPAFLVVGVISAAINVLALASPLYMLQLYDRVLSSRSIDTLIYLTAIVVAALGVLSILDAFRRACLTRLGDWLDGKLAKGVLSDAIYQAAEDKSAPAVSGPQDLTALKVFFTGPAIISLMDTPWSPLFIAALFLLHPLLGIVGSVAALLLILLAITNEFVTRGPVRAAGAASMRGEVGLREMVANAEVIRSMGMHDAMAQEWQRRMGETKHLIRSAANRATVVMSISRFSRLFVQTAIMGTGAWLVINNEGNAGLIFASSFLLSRALAPIDNMIGTWSTLVDVREAYGRLKHSSAPARRPTDSAILKLPVPNGDVAVEDVTYVPPGCRAPALMDISFNLQSGESLAIIGPTAAGKTVLVRLLAGVAAPTEGNVRLDHADIAVWQRSGGAAYVGYLPQDIELFTGSVAQNIARFRNRDDSAVMEAARAAGLHETIMRFPDGYDTQIGAGGFRLSGGLRQRVGLARAVFGWPRVVVLDEPNSSLDAPGEIALDEMLKRLKSNGTTVVVVSHRPKILDVCDKLLLVRNGRMDAFGSRTVVIARLSALARSVTQGQSPVERDAAA